VAAGGTSRGRPDAAARRLPRAAVAELLLAGGTSQRRPDAPTRRLPPAADLELLLAGGTAVPHAAIQELLLAAGFLARPSRRVACCVASLSQHALLPGRRAGAGWSRGSGNSHNDKM